MRLVRYKANRKGVRSILGGEQVRAELHERAERIAAVAQAAYDADPPNEGRVDVVVESETGTSRSPRARARVIAYHPAVLPIEAERRVLGSALDAGG